MKRVTYSSAILLTGPDGAVETFMTCQLCGSLIAARGTKDPRDVHNQWHYDTGETDPREDLV